MASHACFAKFGGLALLALFSGCGSDQAPVYPTQGKLLVRGQPAANAFVQFYPQSGLAKDQRLAPRARVAADGRFHLMTFQPGDGAPAGTYQVTVEWPGTSVSGSQDPESSAGPDRLQGRYQDPARSGLTAEVPAQAHDLGVWDLK